MRGIKLENFTGWSSLQGEKLNEIDTELSRLIEDKLGQYLRYFVVMNAILLFIFFGTLDKDNLAWIKILIMSGVLLNIVCIIISVKLFKKFKKEIWYIQNGLSKYIEVSFYSKGKYSLDDALRGKGKYYLVNNNEMSKELKDRIYYFGNWSNVDPNHIMLIKGETKFYILGETIEGSVNYVQDEKEVKEESEGYKNNFDNILEPQRREIRQYRDFTGWGYVREDVKDTLSIQKGKNNIYDRLDDIPYTVVFEICVIILFLITQDYGVALFLTFLFGLLNLDYIRYLAGTESLLYRYADEGKLQALDVEVYDIRTDNIKNSPCEYIKIRSRKEIFTDWVECPVPLDELENYNLVLLKLPNGEVRLQEVLKNDFNE